MFIIQLEYYFHSYFSFSFPLSNKVGHSLTQVPHDHVLHTDIKKLLEQRKKALDCGKGTHTSYCRCCCCCCCCCCHCLSLCSILLLLLSYCSLVSSYFSSYPPSLLPSLSLTLPVTLLTPHPSYLPPNRPVGVSMAFAESLAFGCLMSKFSPDHRTGLRGLPTGTRYDH